MLTLLAVVCVVVNALSGLAVGLTRGGVLGQLGLPPPLPFYADLMAIFLIASGVGFIPAVIDPVRHRAYLWIFGVGVKAIAASLFANLWFKGLVGYLVGLAALADAAIAALLLWALLSRRREPPRA